HSIDAGSRRDLCRPLGSVDIARLQPGRRQARRVDDGGAEKGARRLQAPQGAAGIHCGAPAYAKQMIEMGFTFVTVGGDNRFMTMGGQAAMQEMRAGNAGAAPKSSSPY